MRKRFQSGNTDFGGILIPSRPIAIVLTDRDDGTKYMVSFNTDAPERLSINTDYASIQRREGIREYEAYEGPTMDTDGEYRLFIRAGRIGLDYNAFPVSTTDLDQAPPYSRKNRDEEKLILDQDDPDVLRVHIGLETDG
jgi:hypothetical protein